MLSDLCSTFLKLLDLKLEIMGPLSIYGRCSCPVSVCPDPTKMSNPIGRVHAFTNNVSKAYCLNGWAPSGREGPGRVCLCFSNQYQLHGIMFCGSIY
jgi:hypothetical protein